VWRAYRELAAEAARRRPRLAILVDFPDFNLRLARRLRAAGIRIVYFISPQVWAWRPGRVRLMKRLVERVLCIFPFEEKFYRDAGVQADFVGHPLVDSVRATMSRDEFAAQHGLDAAQPIVALLPGSRPGEIAHNLPGIRDACRQIEQSRRCQWVLAAAPGATDEQLREAAGMRFVRGATYDALAAANA